MSGITFEILAIFILLIANGVFAMSELAIVSARKARLQQRAAEGDHKSLAALELANAPQSFLSTVQIGITLVGILAGAFGGASLSERLAPLLVNLPFIGRYADSVAFGVVVLIITYFSLVIGELVPKRLALRNPENLAAMIALPMNKLSTLASPVVKLLDGSTNLILRIFGLREATEPPVTEDEIKVLIEQGINAGVFEEAERYLIERVFHLGDRRVEELMVPRTEMVWLDIEDSSEDIRATILSAPHSRFPIIHGSPDNVLGIVQAKKLLAQNLNAHPINLKDALEQPLYVPESMAAFRVLEEFKKSRIHIALVINEHGGVEGLVTINDILEALVGELPEITDRSEQAIVAREDGSWLVDGRISIEDFKKHFEIKKLPGEELEQYQTMGGFIMTFLGRIPSVADHFDIDGMRFEVMDMDRNRVDKILVTRKIDDVEQIQE